MPLTSFRHRYASGSDGTPNSTFSKVLISFRLIISLPLYPENDNMKLFTRYIFPVLTILKSHGRRFIFSQLKSILGILYKIFKYVQKMHFLKSIFFYNVNTRNLKQSYKPSSLLISKTDLFFPFPFPLFEIAFDSMV